MINSILNNARYGEILWLFVVFAWFFMRLFQRRTQKKLWYTNMEFWVYYNLIDVFKDLWYPYAELRASEEIKNIKKNIKYDIKRDYY